MAYRVQLTPAAEKSVERLQPLLRRRVWRAMLALGDEPRPRGMRLVHGYAERTYRVRVSEYRILYEIHDDEVLVLVVRVAHRKDAYELREHEEPYEAGRALNT